MGEKGEWTEEKYEMVRKFYGEHGPKWRILADELGKHWVHVGNAWNRIKLANQKKGSWAQEEIQTLFDLVNADLLLKLCDEKKSKHGMLRDNISWSKISNKLSTRNSFRCCNKWYRQLTSSMVAAGEWASTDVYRLIDALFELDASCIEDVDWDNLLDHRSGELCRKRWNQMVRQLSQHENKSFVVQVEQLAHDIPIIQHGHSHFCRVDAQGTCILRQINVFESVGIVSHYMGKRIKTWELQWQKIDRRWH